MRCPIETQESAELLLAYCARKLDPESTITLERHMVVCPACREFQEQQQAVWDAMDAWDAAPVSEDFDRRLYRRIEAEGQTWRSWLARRFGGGMLAKAIPVAAAACVVLVAGLLMDRQDNQSIEPRVETVLPAQVESTVADMELLHEFAVSARREALPASAM